MKCERTSEIPIAGSVAAGFPSPEEEALRDIISIDQFLCVRPGQSFLLEVTGDSMSGAGIIEGDLVIVEKGRTPKNGDIVVAQVDGDWTMKYFTRRGRNVILEAANPKYPSISLRTELPLFCLPYED
jgi:SOS regulatory protein LexA